MNFQNFVMNPQTSTIDWNEKNGPLLALLSGMPMKVRLGYCQLFVKFRFGKESWFNFGEQQRISMDSIFWGLYFIWEWLTNKISTFGLCQNPSGPPRKTSWNSIVLNSNCSVVYHAWLVGQPHRSSNCSTQP